MADKILVVDDDQSLRKMLVTVLSKHYQVEEAASGEEALKIAAQGDIRLVLLDVMMPGMSGHEICLKLRRNPRTCHATIVMLTARKREEDVVEGFKLGADDYVTKPFKFSELIARIDSHLRRQWRELQASPLTGLPGNLQIQSIIKTNLKAGIPFSVIYADLNNFKAYNDVYGYAAGDEVLNYTANVLTTAVNEIGDLETDFVGHIGGDDFIIVTAPERSEKFCKNIIQHFDSEIGDFYNEEDLARGGVVVTDRQGNHGLVPLLAIALAVVISDGHYVSHPGQIAQIAAELKKQAKLRGGSFYLLDRRNSRWVTPLEIQLPNFP
ncbi:MAG: response regulator [Blastocatellia bacterium]|nr:response regulator [Blastocatellia bacterium]